MLFLGNYIDNEQYFFIRRKIWLNKMYLNLIMQVCGVWA